MLEKTLLVDKKRQLRLESLSSQKNKEVEEDNTKQLFQGHTTTPSVVLDQEDAQRKVLLDAMIRESNQSNGPVVKVLTNVHGNLLYLVDPASSHMLVSYL